MRTQHRLRGGLQTRENDCMAKLGGTEREVFTCLVNGYRAKEIAEILDISLKTVDACVSSIKRKLNDPDESGPSAAGAGLVN